MLHFSVSRVPPHVPLPAPKSLWFQVAVKAPLNSSGRGCLRPCCFSPSLHLGGLEGLESLQALQGAPILRGFLSLLSPNTTCVGCEGTGAVLPYLSQQKTKSALITLPLQPWLGQSQVLPIMFTPPDVPSAALLAGTLQGEGTTVARGTSPTEMIPNMLQLRD